MFTLIREVGLRASLCKEAPYLVSAFLIAECFYKFHSFTLECGAFLATWFLFSAAAAWVTKLIRRPQDGES